MWRAFPRQPCPLCGTPAGGRVCHRRGRDFLFCPTCQLVFVPREQFLTAQAEKAEYDLHQNSPDDPGYRSFLGRLFTPLRQRLPPASDGLDFGAGPGPTLSLMFEEIGHRMAIYDRFYARDPAVLKKPYDFITASEVLEHLHHPREELDRLWRLLRPGGWLGVMTQLVRSHRAFGRWRYKDDPTHVCFFSRSTFEWLAAQWGARLTFADRDVALFRKPENFGCCGAKRRPGKAR